MALEGPHEDSQVVQEQKLGHAVMCLKERVKAFLALSVPRTSKELAEAKGAWVDNLGAWGKGSSVAFDACVGIAGSLFPWAWTSDKATIAAGA